MSVATDLQTEISNINAAIAGGKTFRRTDLERLRRSLGVIRSDASREHRTSIARRDALGDLITRVEDGCTRFAGAVASARHHELAAAEAPAEEPQA